MELAALRDRFIREGWDATEVMALQFVDPVGSNLEHAEEIEGAIQILLDRTGASKVDVVAHSMGGLALWALLHEKGEQVPVRRVVLLASPLQGTMTAYLAWGEGGKEMRPESGFLQALWTGPRLQEWVEEVLTIRTPVDLNVLPGDAATLPGVPDTLICCPTHEGLLDHEETFQVTKTFLLQGLPG